METTAITAIATVVTMGAVVTMKMDGQMTEAGDRVTIIPNVTTPTTTMMQTITVETVMIAMATIITVITVTVTTVIMTMGGIVREMREEETTVALATI